MKAARIHSYGPPEVISLEEISIPEPGDGEVVVQMKVLKRGGILVSSVAQPSQEQAQQHGVRAMFFLVEVTTERLKKIAELIDAGELATEVGEVLWLHEACHGHEMIEGAPHR